MSGPFAGGASASVVSALLQTCGIGATPVGVPDRVNYRMFAMGIAKRQVRA